MRLAVEQCERQFQAALGDDLLHLRFTLRTGAGHDKTQVGLTLKTPGGGLQKQQAQLAQFTVTTARHQRNDLLVLTQPQIAARGGSIRFEWYLIRQGMAYATYRHAMTPVDLLLERKQSEHQVGRFLNSQNTLFTPGPHRRTDVVHRGNARFAQTKLYAQCKIRGVDANEHIRLLLFEPFDKLLADTQ